MNVSDFSKRYIVRKLNKEDIGQIYELCKKNTLYYQYCPPFVTCESIEEDLTALPPNILIEHKYYVGYYEGDKLIAVMDLIEGYPETDIVYIGFFMRSVDIQKRGIGTAIIQELLEYVRTMGYKSVQLAWVKGNPQSEHFWIKNGFAGVKESFSSSAGEIVILAEYNFTETNTDLSC